MPLVELLRRDATRPLSGFAFLSAVAALANTIVLAVLNLAAAESDATAGVSLLLIFLLAVALLALAQGGLLRMAAREIEGVLDRCRRRMAEAVLNADLLDVERVGTTRIEASMARETRAISETQTVLVVGAQSALTMLFTLGYIASISTAAFLVTGGFIALAALVHRARAGAARANAQAAMGAENRLFDRIRDLLDGFAAVRLNEPRERALAAAIRREAEAAAAHGAAVRLDAARQFVGGQVGLFLLIGAMVFIVPALTHSYSDVVVKLTTSVLFMVGPIGLLAQAAPVMAQANAAAAAILTLEGELAGLGAEPAQNPSSTTPFRRIALEGAAFAYPARAGEPAFAVGPLDFTLDRGETVFLTGGNGAGKSTFLRLFTGLHRPQAGRLAVDGAPIAPQDIQSHRDRIAAVFGDFHLPRRLRGLGAVDPAEAQALLQLVELDHVTAFAGDRFTRVDLSSGQRRRLMLVAALLQDRPALALDEFAADLDPAFRRRFYGEILDRLKARGLGILAATHDERYFAAADRRVHLADGRFTPAPAGQGA